MTVTPTAKRPYKRALPLVVGLGLLLVWELACRVGQIDPYFLPAPSVVLNRLVADLSAGHILGFLGTTIAEALAGALLAAAVAIPLGYLTAKSRVAATIIEPYAAASQAIPAIAMAPLLVLWIGYGFTPIIVLCAIMVFFPMMLGTALGLSQIPHEIIDAARLDGAGSGRLLRHIEFPLALPALLTGLRNGLTLSMTGAVVGEFSMGGRGLGMVLTMQRDSGDTTGLFSTITLLAACAIALYGGITLIERRMEFRL